MPKRKPESGRISVFKGREAKLNRAIFHILALKGPLTIYDVHKEVKAQGRLRHVRYASVNKRIRILEKSGYVWKTGIRKTKAGFEAFIYELSAKGYLAMLLNSISLDDLLHLLDETTSLAILMEVVHTVQL